MTSTIKAALAAVAAVYLITPGVGSAEPLNRTEAQAKRWMTTVERRLDRTLIYPSAAALAGRRGVAEVGFRVAPTGELSDVRVEATSGHADLDAAAVQAVTDMRRLPAPPAYVQARRVVVQARYDAPAALRAQVPLRAQSSYVRLPDPTALAAR